MDGGKVTGVGGAIHQMDGGMEPFGHAKRWRHRVQSFADLGEVGGIAVHALPYHHNGTSKSTNL